jgi:hypothetical protein
LLFEDGLLLGGAIGLQFQPPLCREIILADCLCLCDIGQELLLEGVSHKTKFRPRPGVRSARLEPVTIARRRRTRCDQTGKALHRWSQQKPADLASIHQPVLVMNGDSDTMVSTKNTIDLDRRLANSETRHPSRRWAPRRVPVQQDFVKRALEFL